MHVLSILRAMVMGLSLLVCIGVAAAAETVPDGRDTAPLPVPEGEIRIAFVIGPDAEVVDFAGPWGVFEYVMLDGGRNPFRLYTVAASTRPVQVSGGLTVVPAYSFANAPAPHVVVVPAVDTAKAPKAMHDWLRRTAAKADLTMSICDGAYALAEAGLLDGRSATAHHGGYGMLAAQFPKVNVVRGVRWVEDGRIATSGGLTSGIDLALRVVERYFGREVASKTALHLEYQGEGWKAPALNAVFAKALRGTPEHPICPVCGAELDRKDALSLEHDGETHHFCGSYCRDHFRAAPEKFITPP